MRQEILDSANQAGVQGIIVPSYSSEGWEQQSELNRFPDVRQALGLHPWTLGKTDFPSLEEQLEGGFRTLAPLWGSKLVGVGEFGLDRSSPSLKKNFETQKSLFVLHVRWAQKLSLPVILHVVRAHGAALELLKEHRPSRGGVLHSYGGSPELIAAYTDLGLYFSFSGTLFGSHKARESLKRVSPERILFETDGPHGHSLACRPHTEPRELLDVVKLASEILGRSKEWCWSVHRENTLKLFGL